jgi:hypothetical protein
MKTSTQEKGYDLVALFPESMMEGIQQCVIFIGAINILL